MADAVAEIVRVGYEEAFAGKPERLLGMITDDYRHYGADADGVYHEYTTQGLTAMMTETATRAEIIDEVVGVVGVGDEIVLIECLGKRRSLVSDAYAEFRWVILVNVVDGRIPRTMDMGEQAVFDFYRSLPTTGADQRGGR